MQVWLIRCLLTVFGSCFFININLLKGAICLSLAFIVLVVSKIVLRFGDTESWTREVKNKSRSGSAVSFLLKEISKTRNVDTRSKIVISQDLPLRCYGFTTPVYTAFPSDRSSSYSLLHQALQLCMISFVLYLLLFLFCFVCSRCLVFSLQEMLLLFFKR